MGLSDHAILKRRGFKVRAQKHLVDQRQGGSHRLMIKDANGLRRMKVDQVAGV